ncbi:hypothetical protein [Bradyrhizobium sp. LMTR 3]|uniref:hypothetical protein n=1 Tax=Bradyrhizobium sp. LMTR 3 TaxID=189873 RepID=UPI0008108159|nr:hypothetical protein [Bradyrhizobium sp. LMTR 3]OCK59882.1 hypothetical protein LMTR3_19900 [Bradyrhizobium sp. LMTR 3]
MKFYRRTPRGPSICIECRRSLVSRYQRDISTQQLYCDYDCYLRYRTKSLFAPWLGVARDHGLAPEYLAHLETLSSFAALATASYWYSIVVAKAALGLGEPMMVETSKT